MVEPRSDRPMLALSTLGCPGMPLAQVADLAARHGFGAVELRATAGEPVHVGMDSAERRSAAATLAAAGIRPLAVASYVRVADGSATDEDVVTAAVAHGRLAADLGAAFLRVFPGGDPEPSAAQDDRAADRLRRIRSALQGAGVTVALETHDSHPRGADCARLLDRAPGVLAIWDALHPWRSGEQPAETARALAGRIGYLQVKDVRSRDDPTPLPPGDGVLPLGEIADVRRRSGDAGPVSWEYERAWFPDRPALADLAGSVARRMRETFG